MKSLKDFKCGLIIPNVDIKKGKNSQFFGEITIKASPSIYKLDGVGPMITDPPPMSFTTLSEKKEEEKSEM